ncbi:type II toxin-antitoxin system RelE/ParE family toxin [Thiosulfativibrio zosterae]|uniref:Type II toxin-antitoxin system RelE/ParE family toxin n=1 Tax=Thiosulfativibrio zosterae TaxID=2675053 RepID=A0A6F8PKC1_9GAMM|nr:type II toxin-antitoxin system RelE/ParE family toxin [Thiosulfativibrio zosterae]BBP42553.1 hypothetical protein THMIRHAT_02990 [Thiosulfativibrio zosterae]
MKHIRLSLRAEQDLEKGFAFYEHQQIKLGYYFLDSLKADIDSLVIKAGVHQVTKLGYFVMIARRFPYAIYYRVEQDLVLVDAILDTRQNPQSITQRFS